MPKVWNFSAGPAVLPRSVLSQIQNELLDYQGSGISVMEMSHRSPAFQSIIDTAEALLRSLLKIPANYHVLFLQGGATLQFAMAALNLNKGGRSGYIQTGKWSEKAYQEARTLGLDAVEICSSAQTGYRSLPSWEGVDFSAYDYVHITSNNTIEGTQFQQFPNTGQTPLVADMSSDILARPIDISQFGLVYAGAQKNLGPAGVTLVIIRHDLVANDLTGIPTYLKYATHVAKKSLYNTPATFSIYAVQLVLQWLLDLGGVEAVTRLNQAKAALLYEALDNSSLFSNDVHHNDRSMMNIPFTTGSADMDRRFIDYATAAGFINLKGHRSKGGMRASIYNAFPIEGVEALITLMNKFETGEK